MKMHRLLLLLMLPLLSFGCEKMALESDYVFIRHKGADMPLWVRGNTDSEVFIIYLHGGPGGSSFIDIQNDFLREIEAQYAVAYYDQRASGNAIGRSDEALLTLPQFVEDLDIIVDFIQAKYNPEKTILLGHSWGGTLGTAYLLDPALQAKIDAWIEVDGGHNIGQTAYEYSRDYVLSVAERQIEQNQEIEDWTAIQAYYEGISTWRAPEVIIQHSKYVTKAGGYFFDELNREGLVGLKQILFSETDFLALLAQNKQVVQNMDIWHYDFTARLAEIQIPILILWGEHDGILPVQLAYEANDALNLAPDQFYVFQESAHSPHYEETELFNQKVLSFIADYVR